MSDDRHYVLAHPRFMALRRSGGAWKVVLSLGSHQHIITGGTIAEVCAKTREVLEHDDREVSA